MNDIFFESEEFGRIPCRIKHNSRSTRISVRIKHSHLSATIPYETHSSSILELIEQNRERIEKVLKYHKERHDAFHLEEPQSIIDGCKIPFQGKMLPVKVYFTAAKAPVFKLRDGYLEVRCLPFTTEEHQKLLRKTLIKFYYSTLKEQLPPIFTKFEKILQVSIKRVTIKSQRTRWGSCSSLGNVNINWRLILTPPVVLEAVIAHELCHIIHPNHSKRFYNLLDSACATRTETDSWLKESGSGIMQLFSEF